MGLTADLIWLKNNFRELEVWSEETIQKEVWRVQKMKNPEEKVTDVEVTMRRPICLNAVPEKEKETRIEVIFEKTIVENFPEKVEDINL